MGIVTAEIYADTSFKSGECQTGYIIKINKIQLTGYTGVFTADNNNDGEILGIGLAVAEALNYVSNHMMVGDPSYRFKVYNDSMIATTVMDSKFPLDENFLCSYETKKWCEENNVILDCFRMKRNNPLMKQCDQLSKSFRKQRRFFNE